MGSRSPWHPAAGRLPGRPERCRRARGRCAIREAVVAEERDLTTLQYIRTWFGKNLPTLAGSITGLIIHPVVGKIVEAAGEPAASQFRALLGDTADRR